MFNITKIKTPAEFLVVILNIFMLKKEKKKQGQKGLFNGLCCREKQ